MAIMQNLLGFSGSCKFAPIRPNFANVGGLQTPGVKGEVVVLYFEPLSTQNLKSSGVPGG